VSAPLRTIVADDEPIARARMVALLRDEADVDIVGECASGGEAQRAIAATTPDLVFLDIQMPELDGLTLARTLQSNDAPVVVFVTAYDEYALSAFEVHALDYLLKPFSAERLRAALVHARAHVARRRADAGSPPERAARDRLMIKSGGRIHVIRTADIDWCEAAGNYVGLHVGAQCHLVRDTMAHLEASLDRRQFVRVHRSAIVNVDRVREMQPSFGGEYVIVLRDGTRLTLSRGYRDTIQARLGKPL
jgi:two-component system LytT family response regulator